MQDPTIVSLPPPTYRSEYSFEELLHKRRSIRYYTKDPLSLEQLGQLCWAAYGRTSETDPRKLTVPSAGALNGMHLYVVVSNIENLPRGIYQYNQNDHSLLLLGLGDKRSSICSACHGQYALKTAPVLLVLTADYERIAKKYGKRSVRYCTLEVGHSAQNIYIQVSAMNLATFCIGAFLDLEVQNILLCDPQYEPLYIMPVGHPDLELFEKYGENEKIVI